MFTQTWFEDLAKKNFENFIEPLFKDKPINYLEIGCFEGNCTHYMFKNVLTNIESKATIIDPFEDSKTHPIMIDTFKNNLKDYLERITIIKGYSNIELPKLNNETYDFIYVDGDHSALAAFQDGMYGFPLLKSGGIMIFDDYLWDYYEPGCLENPKHPYGGINNFLASIEGKYNLVASNWQIVIQKI